jgi:non-specific serine/threonine protein kinase
MTAEYPRSLLHNMQSRPPTPPPRDPEIGGAYRFLSTGTASEWGESYHPGSYCPVHIDNIFDRRYQVIRKLGYGAYSTVWLAKDLQYVCPLLKYTRGLHLT